MQHRGRRLATLCLILLVGILSGFFIWSNERVRRQLDEQRESKEDTVDRLLASISTIASAQQAYAENRSRDVASFTQVSVLIDRITTDAAGLRAADSGASNERLEEFWTALSALMGAGSRARDQFAHGDDNAASETVLASARDHVTQLNSNLRAFRNAEAASYRNARATTSFRSAAALGAAGVIWAAALVLFAVVPWRVTGRQTEVAVSPPPQGQAEPAIVATGTTVPSIDLAAAAALSTELGTLSDQDQLQRLLGRAAEILDARGLVIWMGAGDELFAAAAHGYDSAVLQRIRPIPRSGDNVTAAAWRSGQLRTVSADASGYGAIVAPLLSPTGCVGVLAAETRSGRDGDDTTRAVVTIIASQLASVLAAWPSASTAAVETLDRKAAAS